ncbi:MAG: phosphoserine transaminase [Pseudomonadota bacterium]
MTESLRAAPTLRPDNPCFSSGPCAKRPGWSLAGLGDAALGRSHRAKVGKAKLAAVIERSKAILGLPEDWRLAIVAGSDTGAVEMALWSLLGSRPVEVLAWESFGQDWAKDVTKELALPDVTLRTADYGALPDLAAVDWSRDVVFTWNGTTSGARLTSGDWIADDRAGLAICDATSAVFAMDLPYAKLDVVTWSWQKVLGGEAAHGMLALSPRAAERLVSQPAPRPLPKLFRMTKGEGLNEGLFKGETINTPSLLAVEDALDGLAWAESIGGLPALIARSEANLAAIAGWVETRPWVDFLAADPATRSCTSICLALIDARFQALAPDAQAKAVKAFTGWLEAEGAAYDIASYRAAPAGLRIWGGATVETSDIEALLPWLDWAWAKLEAEFLNHDLRESA